MIKGNIKEVLKDHESCRLRNAGDGIAEFLRGSKALASMSWKELFEVVRKEESSPEVAIYRELIYQWAMRDDVRENLLRKAAPDLHEILIEKPESEEENQYLSRLNDWRSSIQNNFKVGVAVQLVGVICLIVSVISNRGLFVEVDSPNPLPVAQKLEACNRIIQRQAVYDRAIPMDMKLVIDLYQECQAIEPEEGWTAQQQTMSRKIGEAINEWRSKNSEI
ncbi:MAG: hypothetical protein CMJ19_20395 [Phycisphaeraceae bacterium]|nr:hypothetical protein [Phycisphaeraceae bacterium]